jgi:hypothetical protein
MSTQKTDDQIQFDIEYDVNQQPHIKPSKDREKKLGDTVVDTIFQSVTNSYQEIMKEVLKHQSKAVKVINSIKLTAIFCTTDYAKYLYEEKKKYGDAGIKDEKIALAQTIVGCTLSNGASAVGFVKGKSLKVAVGASTAVSVAYDNYDIFDKPLKDHIGSLTAFLVKKKNRDYKKAIEPDSEGIRTKQEIKAGNKAQIKLYAEKVSIPNLIKDHPNFRGNEEGLEKFNKIISELDTDVAKELLSRFMPKNFAGGSCKAQVETGGSCAPDDSFSTNDYHSQKNSYLEEAQEDRIKRAIENYKLRSEESSNSKNSDEKFKESDSQPLKWPDKPYVYSEKHYETVPFDYGMPSALPIRKYEIVHTDNSIGIRGDAGEISVNIRQERGLWEHPMAVGTIWHPIVIDLEGNGLDLINLNASHTFFDTNGDDFLEKTGWIKSGMGLLCYDMNNDGKITQFKEISFKSWSSKAKTDLDGLREEFDTNKDGMLDEKDELWNKFLIWQDKNANGISEIEEIKKPSNYGISGIKLNGIKNNYDVEGNEVSEITGTLRNGNDEKIYNVYDIAFQYKVPIDTWQIKGSKKEAHGSDENDEIYYAGKDNVNLNGKAGNDIIKGGSADNVIIGCKGDDLLLGGSGKNEYIYSKGDGKDTIINTKKGTGYLLFDSTIKKEEVVFYRDSNDLTIKFRNTENDSITIKDWYLSENNKLKISIQDKSIVLIDSASTLKMKDDNEEWIIYAVTGNNEIGGGNKDDYIQGGDGKDHLKGLDGNDIMSGGKGDGDFLEGGAGNDIYFYNRGDGKDMIFDQYPYEYIHEGTETRTKTVTERVQTGQWCHAVGFHGMEVCAPDYTDITREVKYEVPYTEKRIGYINAGSADKIVFGHGIQKELLCKKIVGNNIILALLEKEQEANGYLADTITIQQYADTNNRIELIEFLDSKEVMNFIDVVGNLITCNIPLDNPIEKKDLNHFSEKLEPLQKTIEKLETIFRHINVQVNCLDNKGRSGSDAGKAYEKCGLLKSFSKYNTNYNTTCLDNKGRYGSDSGKGYEKCGASYEIMKYIKELIPNFPSSSVIYSGETICLDNKGRYGSDSGKGYEKCGASKKVSDTLINIISSLKKEYKEIEKYYEPVENINLLNPDNENAMDQQANAKDEL